MEVVEVAPPPPPLSCDLSPIAKGKRTKRLRPHSPIPFTVTSSEESSTTQEIDTARSLILLSRANQFHHNHPNHTSSQHDARGGGGAFVYTCKTCNRSFPSFQALGGHRASHKKPKNEKQPIFSDDEDFPSPSSNKINRFSLNTLSLQLNNNNATTNFMNKSSPSPRMHECSYCGAEFTSGQALGGHMRKHRAGPVMRSSEVNAPALEEMEPEDSRKSAGIINLGLSLDLNLPAPDDDKEKSPKESDQRFRPGIGHRYYSTIN
ncbi:zinc finger family protein [Striga asiatica]|uniref:Zinc finger family protein n=1 Tax=Striga asiatica TaxID=4170 RepID=A0A5A7R0N4_STRAF|nr:zinc finger family protein [Striga asiatica]